MGSTRGAEAKAIDDGLQDEASPKEAKVARAIKKTMKEMRGQRAASAQRGKSENEALKEEDKGDWC